MTSPHVDPLQGVDAVILDLDGTLVDSVYPHVVAWRRALLDVGVDVAAWQIHRAIGMGGDRLVTAVAGASVETALGDQVRKLHDEHFEELLDQVTALDGAAELLEVLRGRGLQLLLASSGDAGTADRLLDLVEGHSMIRVRVAGGDVERSKPATDLLDAALERGGATRALVVGDSVWDVEAARARDLPCVALRTGGVPEAELLEAGALDVFDGPAELARRLAPSG
ncbi:HAD family hydrolase [Nocardioides donggukensis]|uniref:HAD family hydrolase n=1 Tax=Nocardioides donggukensis TaxID=2774019 RepID=UPI00191CCA0B|nr:HAD family hydrolase [Nocardioides donggukensis]